MEDRVKGEEALADFLWCHEEYHSAYKQYPILSDGFENFYEDEIHELCFRFKNSFEEDLDLSTMDKILFPRKTDDLTNFSVEKTLWKLAVRQKR